MTPTLDQNVSMELLQQMAIDFMERQRQAKMVNFTEPVDANQVPNPNLYKRLEYPRAVHNHQTRQSRVVHSKAEHDALGEAWVTTPLPEASDSQPVVKSAGMDDGANDERIESIENRLLSLEQMMGEILDRLPKKK